MIKSPYEEVPVGGETNAPVPATKPSPYFSAWGNLAQQAEQQGWYPAVPSNDTTEYRNKYNNQFNQVVIPDQKERGYISVVGGNKNGKMTIYIKRADGTIDRTLLKDVSPQDVDMFFRSKVGTIQKRTDAIQAGTNSDRMMPDGTYVPLQ